MRASAARYAFTCAGRTAAIYPMKGVIREIVAPERLVFTNIAVDAAGRHLLEGLTTVTFAERAGQNQD